MTVASDQSRNDWRKRTISYRSTYWASTLVQRLVFRHDSTMWGV